MVISSRYAMIAALISIVAAIPVWFHAIEAPTRDTCRDPDAFFAAERIGGAKTEAICRPLEAGEAKGELRTHKGERVYVHVFRIAEVSKLYGSPMSFGFDSMAYLVPRETRTLEVDGDTLLLQWGAFEIDGQSRLEAWMFAQGDTPIRHPFEAWVRLAWRQLFEGSEPLTVMISSAVGRPGQLESLGEATEQWFVATWKQLRASCDS